jgi:polysaccharide export outer membrane protein
MIGWRPLKLALLVATGLFALGLCVAGPANAADTGSYQTAGNLQGIDGGSQGASQDGMETSAASPVNPDYRLGPGDKLRVTVYNEDDLSGAFQIDDAGYVRLPLIGPQQAAGHSALQLEAQVEHALDDGYLRNARVNIEVAEYRPFTIIGEVTKPGEYPYVSNMTIMNAIALAGGYTGKAVLSSIYVRHESEAQEHELALDQLTRIYPGDVVRVPETSFWSATDVLTPISQIFAPVTSLAYVLK